MKRLIALLLTLSLVLSLSTVAFAGGREFSPEDALAAFYRGIWQQIEKTVTPDDDTSDVVDTAEEQPDILPEDALEPEPVEEKLPALAEMPETVNYVSLGDSTSMGYFVGTYNHYYCYRHDKNGSMVSSNYSTYSLFTDYLTAPGKAVNATDLTATGMRSMELRAILDKDFFETLNPREDTDGNGMICDSWYINHLDDYMFKQNHYSYASEVPTPTTNIDLVYEKINTAYTTAIENADVITYDLLNGEGLYLLDRLQNLFNGAPDYDTYYGKDTFASVIRQSGCSKIAVSAAALRTQVEKLLTVAGLGEKNTKMLTEAVDTFLYTYANMALNFSNCVKKIYSLNKNDVQLIVVTPYNPVKGITLTYGDITLDVGAVMGCLVEAVTAYVAKMDDNADRYKLADCSGGVETCLEDFRDGDFMDDVYTGYRESLIEEIIEDGTDDDGVKHIKETDIAAGGDIKSTVAANITAACQFTSLNINDLLAGSPDPETLKLALTSEEPTEEQLLTLLLYLVIGNSRGICTHPSASGYEQKTGYIKKAYNNSYTADGTYLARAITVAQCVTDKVVADLPVCEGVRTGLKSVISSFFSRLLRR